MTTGLLLTTNKHDTMIKSLLAAIPFILAVQQEAAAFSGISLSPERVQLRASTRTTSSIHALTYHKGTSRSVGPLMLSAAQDGEDAISDGDGKIEGRKKRVIVGYKAMMITYLTVGLLSVVKADVTPFLLHDSWPRRHARRNILHHDFGSKA